METTLISYRWATVGTPSRTFENDGSHFPSLLVNIGEKIPRSPYGRGHHSSLLQINCAHFDECLCRHIVTWFLHKWHHTHKLWPSSGGVLSSFWSRGTAQVRVGMSALRGILSFVLTWPTFYLGTFLCIYFWIVYILCLNSWEWKFCEIYAVLGLLLIIPFYWFFSPVQQH